MTWGRSRDRWHLVIHKWSVGIVGQVNESGNQKRINAVDKNSGSTQT